MSDTEQPSRCQSCACTDDDCARCAERTGDPCTWVEPDLCSACVEDSRLLVYSPGDESALSTVILEAHGPVLFAVEDHGQYLSDLGCLGDHLISDVLDKLHEGGLYWLTGRTVATWVEPGGGHDSWVSWDAEEPWRAESVGAPQNGPRLNGEAA